MDPDFKCIPKHCKLSTLAVENVYFQFGELYKFVCIDEERFFFEIILQRKNTNFVSFGSEKSLRIFYSRIHISQSFQICIHRSSTMGLF